MFTKAESRVSCFGTDGRSVSQSASHSGSRSVGRSVSQSVRLGV
jgi:hypothetical protein